MVKQHPGRSGLSGLGVILLLLSAGQAPAEMPAAVIEDMQERQAAGTDEIAPGVQIADVVEALDILGDDALRQRFIALAEAQGDTAVAAKSLFAAMTDAQRLPVLHNDAFRLGREIYVANALRLEERYTTGRLASAPLAEKQRRAGASFDHILRAILRDGELTDLESTIDLARYSGVFVDSYLLHPQFEGVFPQRALTEVMKLVTMQEETARMEEETIVRFKLLAQEIKRLGTDQ
jgi:hypothetical protein